MKHPISNVPFYFRWLLPTPNKVRSGVLATVLLLGLSVWGNQTFHLAQQHAVSLGGRVVCIEGESMEPRFTEQDLVVVVPVSWHEIEVGDVVQFFVSEEMRNDQHREATWIHQVAAKDGNWIRTVGVNNPKLDPFWVHKRDVLGKAVAVYIGGAKDVPTVSDRAMAYFQTQPSNGFIAKE